MKRRKRASTIWCHLDGKKHCDVVQWALAAQRHGIGSKGNVDGPVPTAQRHI